MAIQRTNGVEQPNNGDADEQPIDLGNDEEVIYSSGGDTIPVVDPSTLSGDNGSGQPRKHRGRPKGSRNASSKPRKETASDLSGLLLSIHMMGAAILKIPELEIDQKEAELLGARVAKINELYGGIVLPEKTMAWINLTMAAGQVYGPRFIAHSMRVKQEKKEGKRPVTIDAQPQKVH